MPTTNRRWFQFSLRSLMAFVVMICLGLGGWNLLLKYGQYVEVEEPVVIGQPIKVRGRFFGFGGRGKSHYHIVVSRPNNGGFVDIGADAEYVGFGRYTVELNLDKAARRRLTELLGTGDYMLTLTPEGHSPIHRKFAIHRS